MGELFSCMDLFFWPNLLTLHKMRRNLEKIKTLLLPGFTAILVNVFVENPNKNKGCEVLVCSKYYKSKNMSFLFLLL